MRLKISNISKLLLLSVSFTMAMLLVRFLYSNTMEYRFYGWNTFLAAIPYLVSTQLLKMKKMNGLSMLMLLIWLLFFPNAPYIITDILHYEVRPEVPYWYDVLLVASGAWNGLILGLVSLMNVETFFLRFVKPVWATVIVFLSLFLCAYGIFLGRFLRYNSWDIVTVPSSLVYNSARHVLRPQQYSKLWVFTLLFAVLLCIIYYTLRYLPKVMARNKE